jgi:hypothetical protein
MNAGISFFHWRIAFVYVYCYSNSATLTNRFLSDFLIDYLVLKISEKIRAKNAMKTLKQNLQEKELTYNK